MKKNSMIRCAIAGLALAFLCTAQVAKAQHFNVGDNDLNICIGFLDTYSGYGYSVKTSLPPLSVSLDHGLRDDWGPGVFSIGGYIGGTTSKYDWAGGTEYWKYSTFIIGARATYHYEFTDKLDTYGGLIVGIRNYSAKYTGNNTLYNYNVHWNRIYTPIFVGAKYYFADNFSVMGELGWMIAWINLGVGLKF